MAKANKRSEEKNDESNEDEKSTLEEKNNAKDETEESNKELEDTEEAKEKTEETETETEPEPEKEKEEEPPELTKEDIIKILKSFPGVGQVMAERIFDAGFDSRETLKTILPEDLKKISGIGQTLAENISKGIENAIKDHDKPPEVPAKKEGPGISDKAVGFLKGTIAKLTGFFKGKSPKPKSKESEKPSEILESGESDSKEKLDETKTDENLIDKEKYYPEVGAPETAPEPEIKPESVTVEPSDEPVTELPSTSEDIQLEDQELPEEVSEPELEQEPELDDSPALEITSTITEPIETPELNLNDSSGLLLFFESTPNLRTETGKLLFKAGYNNLNELREAVIEDLLLVKGVEQYEAKAICDELSKLN
jgi:hypothetical protein